MICKRFQFAFFCAALNLILLATASAAPTSQPATTQPGGADSPRALLETLHKSVVAMDVEAAVRCMPPDYRELMRPLLRVQVVWAGKGRAVFKLAEQRLGKEQAKVLRDRLAVDEVALSPLPQAIVDGKVDWDMIQIVIHGIEATVEVAGQLEGDLEMQQLGGRWYWMPAGLDLSKLARDADAIKGWECWAGPQIKVFDDFEAKLKAGKVTKENAMEELDKSLSAVFGHPTTSAGDDH